MNDSPSSSWDQPFADDPTSADGPRDVAAFVVDTLWDIHEHAPSRRQLREFCEGAGYSWNHIAREARREKIARHAARFTTGDDTTYSPSGIAVNAAVMAEVLGELTVRCPFTLPFVDSWTFQSTRLPIRCKSWCCPTCSLDRAEELLHHVDERIKTLPEVYIGEAPWEPKLAARVSRRRKDRDINMFWYQRADDKVFYVADKPFNGTEPPTVCRPLPAAQALDWLAREVMWVPGHVNHNFSKQWAFPVDDASGSDLVSAAGLNDDEIAELLETFADEAERRFGVRIDCGDIPRVHHDDLVKLLKALINNARELPS
jgi:hypothetical protein